MIRVHLLRWRSKKWKFLAIFLLVFILCCIINIKIFLKWSISRIKIDIFIKIFHLNFGYVEGRWIRNYILNLSAIKINACIIYIFLIINLNLLLKLITFILTILEIIILILILIFRIFIQVFSLLYFRCWSFNIVVLILNIIIIIQIFRIFQITLLFIKLFMIGIRYIFTKILHFWRIHYTALNIFLNKLLF